MWPVAGEYKARSPPIRRTDCLFFRMVSEALGPVHRASSIAGALLRGTAIDLRGVQHGVVIKNPNYFPAVVSPVVFDFKRLCEEDGRRVFALTNLRVFVLCLLVGHPARIAAPEGAQVHAEDQDIDAVI